MILIKIEKWSEFKSLVIESKKLLIQYESLSNGYKIYAEEKGFVWYIHLTRECDGCADFEANYKESANKPLELVDSSGYLYSYQSPFASSAGFRFRGHGMAGTATKNTTSNIDFKILEERYLNGCMLILKNHVFGDKLKFQVVDVDNIVGYGAGTVLDEFGTDWYVSEDSQDQGMITIPYPAKIIAGLYIRIVYISVGTENDVQLKCNLFLHKKVA
jgi:hypothetical protein